MESELKAWVEKTLALADVHINGQRPWDITVHNDGLYARIARFGTLGLGEAYMDGWWDAPALDQFFYNILIANLGDQVKVAWPQLLSLIKARLMNLQTPARSFVVGEKHYDAGNDLYRAMLDKRLTYTCGYWKHAETLDEAQEAKLDLMCRKINLQKGQKVLDIGCGWGSFAKFAAEKYGAHVVGVTVSKEQIALAEKLCAGLPVEFRLQDYRDVNEQFDHVVSLGMFEHVGNKNYRTYMEVVNRNLKDDGLFLLHTIGANVSSSGGDPWTEKYIFPNSMLPSAAHIATAIEKLFIIEDWHNFGADYDKTLMAWFHNFDSAWSTLKEKYPDPFYRMWKYYLLSFAGSFRARYVQLWQVVLSKKGLPGGHVSVR